VFECHCTSACCSGGARSGSSAPRTHRTSDIRHETA
jgi:hypothetical protein